MRTIILFTLLAATLKIFPCPITITNDTDQKIMIVDPRGSEAIFLDQNETGVIDPTITHSIMKYIQSENLYFYYPDKTQLNSFYKKYKLTEKYCVDDPKKSELTISQIVNFVHNPSDRFKVQEFSPVKKIHDQHHH